MNDALCALPVDLRAIVLSNIEHVQTRQILSLTSTFREAFSRPLALPRTFDYEGVAGDDIADHLVHVLDRVPFFGNERALELMGDEKNRLCQYACGRNFEVLKWAHNELDRLNELERALDRRTSPLCVDTPRELPWHTLCIYTGRWEPYRGRVSDDFLVLRVLRETGSMAQERWSVAARPEDWEGVTMENGRVVELRLYNVRLGGAVPAEIGQLTSLTRLHLSGNQLTSLPAEIWRLTSLRVLDLRANDLTILPAEIGQLTSLRVLYVGGNWCGTSVPAVIHELSAAGCEVTL